MLNVHNDWVICLLQNPDNANHDGDVDVHKSALACIILWSIGVWPMPVHWLRLCSKKTNKNLIYMCQNYNDIRVYIVLYSWE